MRSSSPSLIIKRILVRGLINRKGDSGSETAGKCWVSGNRLDVDESSINGIIYVVCFINFWLFIFLFLVLAWRFSGLLTEYISSFWCRYELGFHAKQHPFLESHTCTQ